MTNLAGRCFLWAFLVAALAMLAPSAARAQAAISLAPLVAGGLDRPL